MNQRKKLIWPIVLLIAGSAVYAGNLADTFLHSNFGRPSAVARTSDIFPYGASASADPNVGLDSDLGPVELVWKVLKIIKDFYVDPIDPINNSKMAHNAVKYMVASLGDSNSQFLDKDQSKVLAEMAGGSFQGMGAVLKIREKKEATYTDQQLTIVAPLPGSPAEKAGLQPGDVISELNGKWVMSHDPFTGVYKLQKNFKATFAEKKKVFSDAKALQEKAISLDEASQKLMSSKDELNLTVIRDGKELPAVKIVPAPMTADVVVYKMLPDGTGYIHLVLLTADTPKRFSTALKDLADRGAKNVVLDLRNAPGGSIIAAQCVAGALIGNKDLATVVRSKGRKETICGKGKPVASMHIVGLVNMGTEGATEVLAAGLKGAAGMKLIGATTWGNAFERTAFRLEDGSGYTLTTGKYTPAGKKDFHGKGIKPDAVVPMSPLKIGTSADTQLARAVAVVKRPVAALASPSAKELKS